MHKMLLVSLVFLITSCGYVSRDIHDNQTKIAQLEQQMAEAQAQMASQQAQLASLQASRATIMALIADLQSEDVLTDSEIADLQITVQNLTVQIAVLEGYANVAYVVDICGDAAGIVDEILLVMADGRIVASFSDNAAGANTRLSLIGPGNYVSTDGSNCAFNVSNSGVISW